MGWLERLSRGKFGAPQAARPIGFFWKKSGQNALASDTGWNQEVARESFRRAAINRMSP